MMLVVCELFIISGELGVHAGFLVFFSFCSSFFHFGWFGKKNDMIVGYTC